MVDATNITHFNNFQVMGMKSTCAKHLVRMSIWIRPVINVCCRFLYGEVGAALRVEYEHRWAEVSSTASNIFQKL